MASKSIDLGFRVNENQILHGGPNAQPGRRERTQKVDYVPHVQIPIPRHEPSHQPLHALVLQADLSGDRVVALTAEQGVLLNVEGEVQEGGEGVGELEDAGGGDDGCEAGESGDCGTDNEGDGPVNGNNGHPDEFALPVSKGRGVEEFDAYVAVEDCGKQVLATGFPLRMTTR